MATKTPELEDLSVEVAQTTTFVEQREVVAEDARVTGSTSGVPHAQISAISELPYELLASFCKPSYLGNYAWTASQGVGTKFTPEVSLPQILATLRGPSYVYVQLYSLLRCGFKFRFHVNSTRFNSGRVMAIFMPMWSSSTRLSDAVQASGWPHVKLDASASSTAEMVVPFASVQEYMSTNNSDDLSTMGRLVLMVLNQLYTATGTPSTVNISVYISPWHPSLQLAMYSHTLASVEVAAGLEDMLETGVSVIGSGFSGIRSILTGHLSRGFGELTGVTTGLSKMLSAVGLDSPEDPLSDYRATNRAMPSHNRGVGPKSEEIFSLIPATSNVVVTDEYYTTSGDEMDLRNVVRVPMLIQIIAWNGSASVGSQLFEYPVSPMICTSSNNSSPATTDDYSPSFLAMVSAGFCFWRGSIVFRFEVVATPFHSGRILVGFVPTVSDDTASAPSLIELSACPHMEFDLQTGREFEFTVPYNAMTGRKMTYPALSTGSGLIRTVSCPFISLNTSGSPLRTYGTNWNIAHATQTQMVSGILYGLVQTALSTTANVSADIQMNVYIRGGDDFELREPRAAYSNAKYYSTATEVAAGHVDIVSARTSEREPVGSAQLGEKFVASDPILRNVTEMHLKVYLDRMFMLDAEDISVPVDGTSRMPVLTTSVTPLSTFNNSSTSTIPANLFCWYAMMYRFWTGSIKYHYVINAAKDDPCMMCVSHFPTNATNTVTGLDTPIWTDSGSMGPNQQMLHQVATASYQNALVISIPYKSIYDRLAIGAGDTNMPNNASVNGTLAFTMYDYRITGAPDATTYRVWLYYGAGDDFRMFYLIAPPKMTFLKQLPS